MMAKNSLPADLGQACRGFLDWIDEPQAAADRNGITIRHRIIGGQRASMVVTFKNKVGKPLLRWYPDSGTAIVAGGGRHTASDAESALQLAIIVLEEGAKNGHATYV
jgi:hypothetical protein